MDLKDLQPLLDLINRICRGEKHKEIGASIGAAAPEISAFVTVARKAGVDVPRNPSGFSQSDIAEFRAWKVAQRMSAE